jgi:hypothetical protein
MTTLESFVKTILEFFIRTSGIVAVTATNRVSTTSLPVKEVTIVPASNGNIVVEGVTFTALASVQYTFKKVDLIDIIPSVNCAVIYYV